MIGPAEFFITLAAFISGTIILTPIARAFGRRIENQSKQPPLPSAAQDARFDRLEQAVEAVAIEVERIAEGQRFVTKLLADRAQQGALLEGPSRERAKPQG
ncbi:MAG TPA: hypothetical protein VHM30_06795 [Gemmatimonadaceae bacterium]|nr:hypothetical protein [Gemmatimonadaceae bacterium]